METLNTIYGGQEQKVEKQKNAINSTKTSVEDLISADLMSLFWIENKKIKDFTKKEISELSDLNEINLVEVELANIFNVYDKMMTLRDKQPLSLAWVLWEFDNSEKFAV